MASTLKVNKVLDPVSGQEYFLCKAWVNFNGTGVVAIRASGNVSSITDVGVGQYTVNLLNAMPDTSYVVVGGVGFNSYLSGPEYGDTKTTSSFSVKTPAIVSVSGDNRQFYDPAHVHVAVFR